MLKKLTSAIALSTVLSAAALAADPVTIGVINVPLILHEIPQSQESQQALAQEFGPRQQELQTMEEDGRKLAAQIQSGAFQGDELTDAQRRLAQMQSDFNLKARAFQEDERKRSQEEQMKLMGQIQKAIDSIAKERGLSLVLRGEAIAYTINALDISQDVINRVAQSKTGGTK